MILFSVAFVYLFLSLEWKDKLNSIKRSSEDKKVYGTSIHPSSSSVCGAGIADGALHMELANSVSHAVQN